MCMEEDKELSRCSHIHAHAVSQCSVFTRACVPLDFFFFFFAPVSFVMMMTTMSVVHILTTSSN